jgi:integrase/recombinase XerC
MTTFFMPEPLHDSIIAFLDHIKYEKRFSTHTLRAYGDDLKVFWEFLEAQFEVNTPQSISPAMVRSWMASMSLIKMQPRSINRKISSLKSYFKFCLQQGIIASNPAKSVQVLKSRKRLPTYVEEDSMEKLLRNTPFPDDRTGITEYLIVSLLYHTGMRVSELVNLKMSQVDIPRSQIKVLGKGNKERIIPIGKGLVEKIGEYLQKRNENPDEIFADALVLTGKGKAFSSRQIYDIVKKHLSTVTTAEKKSPHVLRHSFATHLTGNGAELNAVKELLGHSSLAATQVYTHNSIERLRDIHKKAHPKG